MKKRRLPLLSLTVAALILLSGCATSPGSSGTPSTDASGGIPTDVERQASDNDDNEICVINQLSTNTFMNWTLAKDVPAGGYGEELLAPGSKSCKSGQIDPPSSSIQVDGYFMAQFEDGETWSLSAKNKQRYKPSFVIQTDTGPHQTKWGCALRMDEDQTVVVDDGKYKFTLLRKSDFSGSKYVVTVSQSAGTANLQAAGCKTG